MRRAAISVVLLILAMHTGCGTMENLARSDDGGSRPLEVYGGVARSVDTVKAKFESELVVAALGPLYAIDVPLSAVGDTLTLPVTLPVSAVRYMIIFIAACRGEI